MSIEEERTGLKSGMPGPEIPYSVSIPMTLGMAIGLFSFPGRIVSQVSTICLAWRRGTTEAYPVRRVGSRRDLQVLASVDPFHLPALAPGVGQQRTDVDDPLALLPGDAGPVVRVGRVGQILVLLELVPDGVEQVLELDALLALMEEPLDGHLLGPADDVLDHGPRVEVLEVEDLLVSRGVSDLQEPVLLRRGVHPVHGLVDHPVDGPFPAASGRPNL